MKGKSNLETAVAPLFSAAASKALVVGGLPRLAALQARSLQASLNALNASESGKPSSGGVRRRAFWGSLSDEVDAADGSIRKVQDSKSPWAEIDTLDETVPSWYSIHNRHCTACQAPLLQGSSSKSSTSRIGYAMTCTLCGTRNTEEGPDRGTKRRLRACSVRKSRKKWQSRSQGQQRKSHPSAGSDSRQGTEPVHVIQPNITALESTRDTTSQHNKEPPAAQTLDEKMKRKARKSRDNRADRAALADDQARGEMGCAESDTAAFSSPHPSSLAAIDPYDEGKERLQKKRAYPLDQKAAQQHKRGKTSDDKAALRDLLSAKRAQRQQADASSKGDNQQSRSGLQDFLTSL